MRQAQLSFAPVASTPEQSKTNNAQHSDTTSNADEAQALYPSTTFPKQTPASALLASSQSQSSTPMKSNDDASSPFKSTPGMDHTMSSSPASSQSPPSSPLQARAPSRGSNMQMTLQLDSTQTQASVQSKPATLEDSGFEIVIPAQATKKSAAPSTPAPASGESSVKPTVHQPKVTKKKKMTEAEKAEQEAKKAEAKAKREEKEQELKAKQEAKEEQQRLKTEAREAKEAELKAKQEAKEEQLRQKAEAREAKDQETQQKKEAREAKEEEQRVKREAREAKEEEQRVKREAKEAEKQKKEEKARKEAATHAKTRNFMSSFLKKPASSSSSKQAAMAATVTARANIGKSDFQRTFIPGVYKDLAPINRWQKPASSELLRILEAQDDAMDIDSASDAAPLSKEDLLADLKQKMPRRKPQPQTADKISAIFSSLPMDTPSAAQRRSRRGIHPPVVVRQVMRGVAESDIVGGEAALEAKRALDRIISDRSLVRLKFIHFEQDRRPGWYGTFTRPSNLIGPRRPFAQDPVLLDYSYDSDDEWEDQGQLEGEDLDEGQEGEEEDKDEEDDDSEMDDWLIDDLEEVDDAESTAGEVPAPAAVAAASTDQQGDDADSDIMEVDSEGREIPASQRVEPNRMAAKRKAAVETTDTVVIQRNGKQKRVKALGRRFNTKLIPFAAGPHWEESVGQVSYALFQPFQVEFLNNASYGLNPFTFECTSLADMVSNTETVSMPPPSASTSALPKTTTTICKATGKQTGGAGTLAELFALANAQDDPLAAPGLPPFPVGGGTEGGTEKRGRPKGVFPDDLLPAFLRLVDGSTRVKPVLVEELKERFADGGGGGETAVGTASVNVSKVAIEKKLNEVAAKDGKGKGSKWVVKGEFRARYGLPALTTPAR
ncbi:hypothetical protein CF319_g3500 [Tilletia indica]|nr:hypothetical protein CF319_g3500 [Tilletia indica]